MKDNDGDLDMVTKWNPVTPLVWFAKWFATFAHWSTAASRYRKYTGEYYITHPYEVFLIVSTVTDCKYTLAAAWLHDTVEDVSWVKLWLIRFLFGRKVAQIVEGVTDVSRPSDGKRMVRKLMDRNHTAASCHESQTVKYADSISNMVKIWQHDPRFAETYFHEKKQLFAVMQRGHPKLRKRALNIVDDYYREKKMNEGLSAKLSTL
jgi:(p)ppGpp synthase/HD superfamily hydrolase